MYFGTVNICKSIYIYIYIFIYICVLNRLPKTYFVQNEFHHLKYNCDTLTCLKKYPQEHIIQLGSFCSLSSCISWMHAGNGLVQLQTCRIISSSLYGALWLSVPLPSWGPVKPLSLFPLSAGARKHVTVSSAQQADVATAIHYDSETFFPIFYTVYSIWSKKTTICLNAAPIVYHALCFWYVNVHILLLHITWCAVKMVIHLKLITMIITGLIYSFVYFDFTYVDIISFIIKHNHLKWHTN